MCEEGLKLTTLLKCRICKVPGCEVESPRGRSEKLTSEAIDGLNRGSLTYIDNSTICWVKCIVLKVGFKFFPFFGADVENVGRQISK